MLKDKLQVLAIVIIDVKVLEAVGLEHGVQTTNKKYVFTNTDQVFFERVIMKLPIIKV